MKVSEKIIEYMWWANWQNECSGKEPRAWTCKDLARRVGCSRGAVHYSLKKLKANIDIKRHWFRTEDGLCMEYYITLK